MRARNLLDVNLIFTIKRLENLVYSCRKLLKVHCFFNNMNQTSKFCCLLQFHVAFLYSKYLCIFQIYKRQYIKHKSSQVFSGREKGTTYNLLSHNTFTRLEFTMASVWPKCQAHYFYNNRYLQCIKPNCDNIFKIVCAIS